MPTELALLYELERWNNALPHAGGYFDQPYTLMNDLRMVRKAVDHYHNSQDAAKGMEDQVAEARKQAFAMAGVKDPRS
jgi:hypothetical protein